MATLRRYTFNCPHCDKQLSSSWGEASYTSLPDAFACPHCRQVVMLSPEQRMDKIAEQRSSKGCLWILLISVLLLGGVTYSVAKSKGTIDGQTWAVILLIGVVGGAILTGVIGVIRKAIIHDRLLAQSKKEKQ